MTAMSTVAKRLQGWSRVLAGRTFRTLNPGCPDHSPFNGSAPAVFRAPAGSGRVDFSISACFTFLVNARHLAAKERQLESGHFLTMPLFGRPGY
jgi:hypothetical protein